jgi:hypothetical protein
LEAFTDAATVDIGRATVVCAAEAEALLAKQVGELRAQLASRYSWAQPLATMMRLGDAVDSRLSEA